MENKSLSYFLASNTGEGFISYFNQIYNPYDSWKMFIIKGGPGTGKSGIMKKICRKADEIGYSAHKIYCSSDPDSLDAVVIPDIKVSVCDGTAPHTMDPVYPGVCETIINLSECWDENILNRSKDHILTLTDCNRALHKRSTKYLAAAASAQSDNEKIIISCTDRKKVDNYAVRSGLKNISCNNSLGNEKKIFLSTNTPKGKYIFLDTVTTLCENIITISDEYTHTSSYLVKTIANLAQTNGKDIITCSDPIRPSSNPQHVIIPEEKTGYFTSDSVMNLKPLATKNINATRFINKDKFSIYKNRIAFNKRCAEKFELEAADIMKKAKSVHDELEKYYIEAINFDKLDIIADSLIKRIFHGN